MESIAVNPHRRILPNALSLQNQDICFVNRDIKVLLPPTFDEKSSVVMSNPSSTSTLYQPKSELSVKAPAFVPRSKQTPVKSSNNIIVLPSFGEDWKVYHYIWKIAEDGKLVAKSNVNVPPPKVIHSSAMIPLQLNYKVAHGNLIADQFCHQNFQSYNVNSEWTFFQSKQSSNRRIF